MHVQVYREDQVLSSDFNRNWKVSTVFIKTPNYIIYEIRPIKKVLIHADRETGKTKLYELYEL
jgi:hypothetical protein